MIRRAFVSAILFGVALAVAPAPADAIPVAACDFTISSLPATLAAPGIYCLDQDLATGITTGFAINITHSNVTLDCGGFWINGLSAGSATKAVGIRATERHGITVRNCGVRGFNTGIRLIQSNMSVVEDNHLEQNFVVGIDVNSYSYRGRVVARRNRVFDTGGSALAAPYSAVAGINAGNEADVIDNLIDGVSPTAFASKLYGIRMYNLERGMRASGNTVRNLMPLADGYAAGIGMAGNDDHWVFIDRNSVSIPVTSSASIAFHCWQGALRDNAAWGFTSFSAGCSDDGGNAQH